MGAGIASSKSAISELLFFYVHYWVAVQEKPCAALIQLEDVMAKPESNEPEKSAENLSDATLDDIAGGTNTPRKKRPIDRSVRVEKDNLSKAAKEIQEMINR